MKVTCPNCDTLIPVEQMDVAADVAACSTCSEVFSLSSIVAAQQIPAVFDINDPPAGAWFYDDITGWRIGASTRSPAAIFLVPFVCVWSGFSLGEIYGTQFAEGVFDLGRSLFGIPFVIGTLLFGGIAMMSVFGRVELIVSGSAGKVFTGIGPFGWARRFDWSEVIRIDEDVTLLDDSGSKGQLISLVGKTRLKFGSGLNEARRYFLLQGLRILRQRA